MKHILKINQLNVDVLLQLWCQSLNQFSSSVLFPFGLVSFHIKRFFNKSIKHRFGASALFQTSSLLFDSQRTGSQPGQLGPEWHQLFLGFNPRPAWSKRIEHSPSIKISTNVIGCQCRLRKSGTTQHNSTAVKLERYVYVGLWWLSVENQTCS